jgi:uroporphyrinogen-III decarboxylase
VTSKERMLAAMRCETVDHLPCSIYFNSNLQVAGYDLTDWTERARLQFDLGADPVAHLDIPDLQHPEVTTRTWLDVPAGEAAPILFKEYRTPAGALRMGVRHTHGWPYKMDIPWNDYTAGHLFEPLIKTPDDVDAFAYLLPPPDRAALDARRKQHDAVRALARQKELAIQGHGGHGLATLLFVMGAENAVMFAVDHPEAFQRLAQIDSRANVTRIHLCAEAGADFIKRFGGYEQTNFYTPEIFRRVVVPLLRQEVAAAHEAGVLIYYRVVTGMEPLLRDIASIGFDCIEGGEPHLSRCSLEMWRDAFAGRACSWTGLSTPGLLGGKDPAAVRHEVRHCLEVFGKRGYILGVTNSIRNHFPWENTLAMIDEWKKIR